MLLSLMPKESNQRKGSLPKFRIGVKLRRENIVSYLKSESDDLVPPLQEGLLHPKGVSCL